MNVGDLVIRKVKNLPDWKRKPAAEQRERLGHGIVLAIQWTGCPQHKAATVFYPRAGVIADIATSLMEVIS